MVHMTTTSNNQMTCKNPEEVMVSILTTSLIRYEAYYVYMCIFHATIPLIPRLLEEVN